jgi:hypothetical protein
MNLRLGTGTNRGNGSGGNNNNNSNNNNNDLPNPPMHPTLADVLAQQTQLLGQLVNHIGNLGNTGNQAPIEEPQVNKYGDFFRTNPPIFRGSKDPMRIFGFMSLRRSSISSNVSNMRRSYSPLTNFMMPRGLGGGIGRPRNSRITASRGRSSGRHFTPSTAPRVSWTSRKRNSLISLKVITM